MLVDKPFCILCLPFFFIPIFNYILLELVVRNILDSFYFEKKSALPSLGFIESRPPLAAARPKCNSILHLFGEWLFEAAHIGGDAWIQNTKSEYSTDIFEIYEEKI